MTRWPYDVLDVLCLKVNLRRMSVLPHVATVEDVPPEVALWTSKYAQLLLWPILSATSIGIRGQADRGQEWFDDVLAAAETGRRRPVDGYLVLALTIPPIAEEANVIRELQRSTQVCRKHAIWPDPADNTGWHGLLDVTILGLPDEVLPTSDADWPSLDSEANAVWRRVDDLGYNAAARGDIEEI